MKFEIYCDESRQDLLSTKSEQKDKNLLIGGLWLPAEKRAEIKERINRLKKEFDVRGEVKWQKTSNSRVDFYKKLIDLFIGFGLDLRFRCIAVEAEKVNLLRYHGNDQELGFYKFYYQLIHHWIYDFNEYAIFCDLKSNRQRDRLAVLRDCLQNANLSSSIQGVQALPSNELVLIQLVDVLLGATASRLNNSIRPGGAKDQVLCHLEGRLSLPRLQPTTKNEQKFNIFVIRLEGGW
ncbi:MAG: DUF3800 domain-containing protein [Acidobacteriia bacterium]|nr:DUF3800 domain-containing protein [Terriglobia bacterium]